LIKEVLGYWLSLEFFSAFMFSLSVYLDNFLVYTGWSLVEDMFKITALRGVVVLSFSMIFYLTVRGVY